MRLAITIQVKEASQGCDGDFARQVDPGKLYSIYSMHPTSK